MIWAQTGPVHTVFLYGSTGVLSFGSLALLQQAMSKLPHCPEEDITSSLKVFSWKHSPEKGLGKEWLGPCILGMPRKTYSSRTPKRPLEKYLSRKNASKIICLQCKVT